MAAQTEFHKNNTMSKTEYSDRIAELNELLKNGEIDAAEYQAEHNAASTSFGITLTEWPCDPPE